MLYREKLARDIIRDYFGEVVETVVGALLKLTRQNVNQIVAATQLEYVQVRNSLIVLIQHNLVKYFTETSMYEEITERKRLHDEQTAMNSRQNKKNQELHELAISPAAKRKAAKEAELKRKAALQLQKQQEAAAAASSSTSSSNPTTSSSSAAEDDDDDTIIYEVIVENIIVRLRFAKFIALARTSFFMEGEAVLTELLYHGRLNLKDLMINSLDRYYKLKEMEDGEPLDVSSISESLMSNQRRRLKTAFDNMVKARFIKRVEEAKRLSGAAAVNGSSAAIVHAPNLKDKLKMQQMKAEKEAAKKKKKQDESKEGADKKKRKRKEEEGGEEEPAAAAEDEPASKKRKTGKKGEAKKTSTKEDAKKKTPTKKGTKKKGDEEEVADEAVDDDKKEEDEEMQFDEEDDPKSSKSSLSSSSTLASTDQFSAEEMSNIIWTCNYDQFYREFRNNAIISYIDKKITPMASVVMRAMLALTTMYERSRCDETSTLIQEAEITQKLAQINEEIPERTLEKILDMMCSEAVGVLSKISQTTNSYVINLADLVQSLKRFYAENIIEQKYGILGSRVFRLLLQKKQLEQKQIAEFAMIHINETRSILYKMFQGGILQLQEVPKSGDHNPTRTFYLWNVNLDVVYQRLTDDMFKTARNLRMRLQSEQQQMIKRLGGRLMGASHLLSEEEKAMLAKLEIAEDRLEASLVRLNEVLMFFA